MKTFLPEGHGLSERVLASQNLMPRSGQNVSLTDAQHSALQAGIGTGTSLLISAPTSTGKTLIGWWAAARGLERGKKVVYLVSHRALASQKFEELQSLFLTSWLENDTSSLICATGDGVLDASGRSSSAPLTAAVLVATYEKYLSLMAAGGPPQDLSDVVFICDEVQLIGDGARGKHVELLLTILNLSGWHQFIGLSAVMDDVGAQQFSEWLGLQLVRVDTREKTIVVEGRWPNGCLISRSTPDGNEAPRQVAETKVREINSMISELLSDEKSPTIVFCMRVDDTYNLCADWADKQQATQNIIPPANVDLDGVLQQYVNKRCAFHNAELSDEERSFIENLIETNQVDVVFATSTLAAGVNFPLGSAVFSRWKRWSFEKKTHQPIRRDEFHNMAGRVGRMGQSAEEGIVLATANSANELSQLQELMDFSKKASLGVGISPVDFNALTIQLFAGGLCRTRDGAFALLSSTLSANREAERGSGNVDHWRPHLEGQIDRLIQTHCLIEAGSTLVVTEFGSAVARNGLKPETAEYFLGYLDRFGAELSQYLPKPDSGGSDDDLLFLFTHGSLLAPEFTRVGGPEARYLNWRLGQPGPISNSYAERLNNYLFERPWVANPHAANGARVLTEWASGASRESLEQILPGVRLGTIQATARDASWVLFAVSQVISSASSPSLADAARHPLLRTENPRLGHIRQFARVLKRYSARIAFGLPSECHWLRDIELDAPTKRLSRAQVLSLHSTGLSRPHIVMDGSPQYDTLRQQAVPARGGTNYPNLIRDAAKRWKADQRRHFRARHERRAQRHGSTAIIVELYEKRGKELETAIIGMFNDLGVSCSILDDGTRPGWPDLLVEFSKVGLVSDLVVEVKSKASDTALVPLNGATEVLAASELAGLGSHPCTTACSPGVEPSVPTSISGCNRLSVVEIADLAEAYLRAKDGNLTAEEFYNWLTAPGIALTDDLPFKNF